MTSCVRLSMNKPWPALRIGQFGLPARWFSSRVIVFCGVRPLATTKNPSAMATPCQKTIPAAQIAAKKKKNVPDLDEGFRLDHFEQLLRREHELTLFSRLLQRLFCRIHPLHFARSARWCTQIRVKREMTCSLRVLRNVPTRRKLKS